MSIKEITILVADDDIDDHDFLREALHTNKFQGNLLFVTDGQQLIDYLDQNKKEPTSSLPELILLDLNMPLCNGFQALTEIKKDITLKNIPVAILTSSFRQEDEEVCYSLGCNNFYRKPSNVSDYDTLANNIITSISAA